MRASTTMHSCAGYLLMQPSKCHKEPDMQDHGAQGPDDSLDKIGRTASDAPAANSSARLHSARRD